jgi:phenylpropionate dioxygenase-like ring-hydroxylating dioxygenase large terminal subunit
MTMNGTRGYHPGLVDLASGQISREIFVNDDIYAQEQERVFARSWLFVGHESQIPNPGDFFASRMGEESVILCRDRAGTVHVFLNSCRHRGMKVCRYDDGNTTVFTCPYHGWSYGTDGALVGVPFFREAYHSALDRAKYRLVEVAQLCCYKGTVWANWDASAPPFLEYLGEFQRFLDLILDGWDGREGQAELLGGVQKWIIPCNWKWPAENFSGDTYHNISHRSVDLVGVGPSGRSRRDYSEFSGSRRLQVAIPDRGHQTITYVLPKDHQPQAAYQNSPEVAEYFRHCEEERRRRPGANSRLIGAPGEIFPQCCVAAPAAAHLGGVASEECARDRGMAVLLCRPRRASTGQELPPRLLHPLLRAGGHDRAGRHGELELCARRQPRHDCATLSLQLRDGARPRGRGLRVGWAQSARPGHRPDHGAGERGADAQSLSPLGPVHGSR